jgi:hypothetical protein
MTTESKPTGALAGVAVRLAAAWILTGGFFKLFLGTPADLPPSTRLLDDLVLTYQVYIAIELSVGFLAMLRPKAAWWLVAGALVVFEAVLLQQMAAGADSCGCFGSKVTMEPWKMAAIDGALLLFVLVSRPWRMRAGGAPWWLALLLAAVGAALPFALTREVSEPGPEADGEESPAGKTPIGRGYVSFPVESWVGQSVYDTPLAKWVTGGVEALPSEGLWIFYRWTCDHCAKHLEELTYQPPDTPFLTLILLKEPQDNEANKKVHVMPAGDHVIHASCPDKVDYILTTPAELWLEGGVIVKAVEGAGGE